MLHAPGIPRGPRELSAPVNLMHGFEGGVVVTEGRKDIGQCEALALEFDNVNSSAGPITCESGLGKFLLPLLAMVSSTGKWGSDSP